jgi:hypothetical protein
VGLTATELGPEGFLPPEPDAMAHVLAQHHLQAIGGFTPVLLHLGAYETPIDKMLSLPPQRGRLETRAG